MALTAEDVKKAATLASLRIPDGEVEAMAGVLSQILDHIGELERLDTSNVPPTSQVITSHNVFRPDEVTERFEPGHSLDNAPARDRNFFSVPRVVED